MSDATETVKQTAAKAQAQVKAQAEAIQKAGTTAFKDGVDRSLNSLTELNAQGKKNLEAVVESAAAAQKGAEALSQQALAYGKKSWEENVSAAQSLSQARSVQELFELQTAWAKSATEAYLAHLNQTSETLTASLKDSFKPINSRVSAAVEGFQSAR
ncbi:TIGR01841 family phasin [Brevundimonas terrae]|uniref:TIGR01841 family phasin n=1 Tax=Brevundimonas terrae TaxID=363631 RepID=A0ABN0YHF1_9CAUL|nr:TIGR01841 family phasin [Brevundimonas terrae]NIJ27220.1 phasin family protein [Brevundimonas terrae]